MQTLASCRFALCWAAIFGCLAPDLLAQQDTTRRRSEAREREMPARVGAVRPAQEAPGMRLPSAVAEPVEPDLPMEERVLGARRVEAAWRNPAMRRTLASIRRGGSPPALVFSLDLRAVAVRAMRATPDRVVSGVRVAQVPDAPITGVLSPLAALDLPPEMPAVHWPTFVEGSCTGSAPGQRLYEAKLGLALAHHHVWRAYQLLEFIGESASQFRDDYWRDGYDPDADGSNWSPHNWFGTYAGWRASAIREVVKELWDRFRSAETDGIQIRIKCPTADDPGEAGNICLTHEPGAHHVVKGWMNLCDAYFEMSEDGQALTIAHELLHHATVEWKQDDLWYGAFLGDTHAHGHGTLCAENVATEKMYGDAKTMHLASTGECRHRKLAMRNNDNYAWFIARLGAAVRSGSLKKFPTEGVPWDTPGGGGNECSELTPPPPGPDIQDPEACFKAGGERVCPNSGGGGGVVLPSDCLTVDLPAPP